MKWSAPEVTHTYQTAPFETIHSPSSLQHSGGYFPLKLRQFWFLPNIVFNTNGDQQTELYILAWKLPQITHHTPSIKRYLQNGLSTSEQIWIRQMLQRNYPKPIKRLHSWSKIFQTQTPLRCQDISHCIRIWESAQKRSLSYLTLDRKKPTELPEIAIFFHFINHLIHWHEQILVLVSAIPKTCDFIHPCSSSQTPPFAPCKSRAFVLEAQKWGCPIHTWLCSTWTHPHAAPRKEWLFVAALPRETGDALASKCVVHLWEATIKTYKLQASLQRSHRRAS